ncbi:hypothetical protein ACFY83_34750 [Streptomyces althioticus]|uniref:hypothetical protein n=1 Tax=Streptomyces TaxID=1883 RepID=UPI001E4E9432|nr:hypothetical protein [Streptomyces sp. MNU103]
MEELRAVPVLALFGERGAGKSVTFLRECRALERAQARTHWVDLGRHQTESQVVSALTAASRLGEAGEWWVFLDSVDEGLNVLPALGGVIAGWIDALSEDQRRGMRLRFTCRTGRWPGVLQETLARRWQQPSQVQHVVLTPLGDDDVAIAAQDHGLQAEAFHKALHERGLTQLSRNPVTLLQLLRHHCLHGALPASAADAYQQACVLLCSETRRPVDIRELRSQPTGERLLPVAARVAAMMQFGAHNVLSDGSLFPATTTDVTLAELEGGHEPGPLGGDVPCTTDELRRLTESHLFEPVGLLRWTFTHRSYQEFLAAHYLQAHQVDTRAQAGLLWVGDGPSRHIYPAHREVAAWRSGSDNALFEDLLRHDPQVLLLADLPARPPADRYRVIDALFDLIHSDDTVSIDPGPLHRLDHSELPQQLLPRLRPDTNTRVLYTALNIAGRCPHTEFTHALLQVAETSALPQELRALALQAIAEAGSLDGPTTDRINELARADDSPEVVAAALQRLWPGHLPLRQLLDLMRDPDPDYYGRAWMLRSDLTAQLTVSQTAQALLWARDMLHELPSERSVILAVGLLSRAVTCAGTTALPGIPRPEAVIGEALRALPQHNDTLRGLEGHTEHQALGHALRAHPGLRRAVTLHLLTHTSEAEFFRVWSALPRGCLITYLDTLHWMERWDQVAHLPFAVTRLLVPLAPPDTPELLARARAAREAHPDLAQLTSGWDQSPEPEPLQDSDLTDDENPTYSEARLREALAAVHTAEPQTVRHAWAAVIQQMWCTTDGADPDHLFAQSLLLWAHHAPSRPDAGSELDTRLKDAARHALATAPPLPTRLLAYGRRVDPRHRMELSALAVLKDPRELAPNTPDHWARLTLALAAIPAHTTDAEDVAASFLPHCAEQAGPALAPLLTAILRADHTDAATTHDLTRAIAVHGPPAALDVLTSWADDPGRSTGQWQSITSALALTRHPKAQTRLRSLLNSDPSNPATTPQARSRWLSAAHILLYSPALPALWPLVHRHLANDTVARDYIDCLGQRLVDHFPHQHQLALLTEEDLAELYLVLARHTAEETLDPPLRSGWAGDDHFGELLRGIPPLLQAKNTPQAAHQLRRMAAQTGLWRLRHLARQTATAAAQSLHVPVTPPQLTALARQSHHRRWVSDEGHLLALVLEALSRFQDALHRPNGLRIALWNRSDASAARAEWWPCWEEDLSDILASFLLQDIGGDRVVIDREVQLDRPGLAGKRTDIQIEVPAPPDSGNDPVKLIIECKGCWNSTLSTALEHQLVDRYLHTPRTAGILLTGYFDCERWTITKRRACPTAAHHTVEGINRHQRQQAQEQRSRKGVPVEAFTLDCTLP